MHKQPFFAAFIAGLFACITCVSAAFAADVDDLALLEPNQDQQVIDFVVLAQDQSTTVTADIPFAPGFELAIVRLIGGDSNFSVRFSRTNTFGELLFIWLQGFGVPSTRVNLGFTPITLNVSSAISAGDDGAIGFLLHGVLFSLRNHLMNIASVSLIDTKRFLHVTKKRIFQDLLYI